MNFCEAMKCEICGDEDLTEWYQIGEGENVVCVCEACLKGYFEQEMGIGQ